MPLPKRFIGFWLAATVAVLAAMAATPVVAQMPGMEFAVTTSATDAEGAPAVARNGDGITLVAWQDGTAVRARRFDAAGAPLDDGFLVERDAVRPDVAIAADGSFVIAWLRANLGNPFDQEDTRAYFQRYAADGTPMGAPAVIEELPDAAITIGVAAAMTADGRFALATTRFVSDRVAMRNFITALLGNVVTPPLRVSRFDVQLRHYDAAGVPVGASIPVARGGAVLVGAAVLPVGLFVSVRTQVIGGSVDLAIDHDGDAIVVWDSLNFVEAPVQVSSSGVQARRVRRGAGTADALVTIDAGLGIEVTRGGGFAPLREGRSGPAITRLSDGRHVVAWRAPALLATHGGAFDRPPIIRVRALGSSGLLGLRTGPAATVAVDAGPLALAATPDGGFVVGWETEPGRTIKARRYRDVDAPIGEGVVVGERQLSSNFFDGRIIPFYLIGNVGESTLAVASASGSNRVLFVWQQQRAGSQTLERIAGRIVDAQP